MNPHPLRLSLTLSVILKFSPSLLFPCTQDHHLLQNLLPLCWLSTGGRGLDQNTAVEAGQLPSPITYHPSLLTTHPHPSPITPHHPPITHHLSSVTPHHSLITRHSSLLTRHYSSFTPHPVSFVPSTHCTQRVPIVARMWPSYNSKGHFCGHKNNNRLMYYSLSIIICF